jgi:hypothetical protein
MSASVRRSTEGQRRRLNASGTASREEGSLLSVADGPAQRTFEIMEWPMDGLACARLIAEKFRLTHDAIKEHIGS